MPLSALMHMTMLMLLLLAIVVRLMVMVMVMICGRRDRTIVAILAMSLQYRLYAHNDDGYNDGSNATDCSTVASDVATGDLMAMTNMG